MKTTLIAAILFAGFMLPTQAAENTDTSNPSRMSEPGMRGAEGQGRRHPEPPAQAYTDCEGKQEGDVVQHVMPNGQTISAVCAASPRGLFARPKRLPSQMQRERQ